MNTYAIRESGCALVLAGGASRRMGMDKLELPVNAKRPASPSILQHAIAVVQSLCLDVYVLGRSAKHGVNDRLRDLSRHATHQPPSVAANVAWLHDERDYEGPLAALATAWREIPIQTMYPFVVIVPGDIPGLHDSVLRMCIRNFLEVSALDRESGSEEASRSPLLDGVVVRREDRPQPLLGVYHPRAGQAFQAAYQAGESRLMRAVAELNLNYLDADALWPPWWTRPVHTPDDYRAWLEEGMQGETGDSG